MDYFLRYILPALIGATAAIIGVWASIQVQQRRIDNDDSASLRGDLMEERKQLVKEIQELQKRCDALEQTNQELINEIKRFGSTLQNEKR